MEKAVGKINKFFRDNHRMPSYAELMEIFSYRSKSAVHYFIKKLVESGYISKDKKGHLIPRKLFGGIKLLGLVEAGFPSPAEEELVDTMNLEEYLITNKDASYILRVKGDSMEDAGIYEGDMVIVERGKKPKNGDIVIAEIDGEYLFSPFSEWSVKDTLEFFHKRKMETKVENENRVFPLNNKSQSVWDVMVDYVKSDNITIFSDSPVKDLIVVDSKVVGVKLKNGKTYEAKSIIIATGGHSRPETGSTGDAFVWLDKVGHKIIKPTPSHLITNPNLFGMSWLIMPK